MSNSPDENETPNRIIVARHIVLIAIPLLFFGNERTDLDPIFFGYWVGKVFAIICLASITVGVIRLFFTRASNGKSTSIFVFALWLWLAFWYFGLP